MSSEGLCVPGRWLRWLEWRFEEVCMYPQVVRCCWRLVGVFGVRLVVVLHD